MFHRVCYSYYLAAESLTAGCNTDGSVTNKSVRTNDFLMQTIWPDSPFHFSLVRSFVLTDESLCCSLFSYQWWGGLRVGQSYAGSRTLLSNFGQWETGMHSNRFHEKKKKTFHFVRSSRSRPLAWSFGNEELRTVCYVIWTMLPEVRLNELTDRNWISIGRWNPHLGCNEATTRSQRGLTAPQAVVDSNRVNLLEYCT